MGGRLPGLSTVPLDALPPCHPTCPDDLGKRSETVAIAAERPEFDIAAHGALGQCAHQIAVLAAEALS
jgi:hypothetical protein